MQRNGRSVQNATWDSSRLRVFPSFKSASDATLAKVASLLIYDRLPAACLAVEQSQPANSMFMLLSGRVVLVLESKDFREMTLEYLDAPAYFGVVGLMDPAVHSSNVTACTPVEILELPQSRLKDILALSEDFAIDLLGMMAGTYSKAIRRLGDNAFLNANERVISVVAMMALAAPSVDSPDPARVGADWRSISGVTHSRLASMACTSRETVCRTLTKLTQSGMVIALPGPPPTRDYLVDVTALSGEYALGFWAPDVASEEAAVRGDAFTVFRSGPPR